MLTIRIWQVGDFEAPILTRAKTLEFITISPIFYIHY